MPRNLTAILMIAAIAIVAVIVARRLPVIKEQLGVAAE